MEIELKVTKMKNKKTFKVKNFDNGVVHLAHHTFMNRWQLICHPGERETFVGWDRTEEEVTCRKCKNTIKKKRKLSYQELKEHSEKQKLEIIRLKKIINNMAKVLERELEK